MIIVIFIVTIIFFRQKVTLLNMTTDKTILMKMKIKYRNMNFKDSLNIHIIIEKYNYFRWRWCITTNAYALKL